MDLLTEAIDDLNTMIWLDDFDAKDRSSSWLIANATTLVNESADIAILNNK